MKIALLISALFLLSCSQTKEVKPFVNFGHQHIITNMDANNLSLTEEGKTLDVKMVKLANHTVIKYDWKPDMSYLFKNDTREIKIKSPLKASPYTLKKINLSFDPTLIADGNFPDIRYAMSDDYHYVAVGTYFGELIVWDMMLDKIVYTDKIAEGMVKTLAFIPGGHDLVIGEVSPDGNVYRFDFKQDKIKWSYRIADDLETSSLPDGENKYGIYTLPGVYHLSIQDNQILIAGLHSWQKGDSFTRKSKLYSFDFDGNVNWSFPDKGAIPTSISFFDNNDQNLVFSIMKVEKPRFVKANSIHLLDLEDGSLKSTFRIKPLEPYFNSVAFWESVSISRANDFAAIGTYDGRAIVIAIDHDKFTSAKIHNIGTPRVFKKIPVMSGISFTTTLGDESVFTSNQSAIPYRYSQTNNIFEPPGLHPSSGSLTFISSDSKKVYSIKNGFVYSSVHTDSDENTFIAMIDSKKENKDAGVFGFSLFEKSEQNYDLIYTYNSNNPAFFRGFLSDDGLIKVVGVCDLDNKNLFQIHIVL